MSRRPVSESPTGGLGEVLASPAWMRPSRDWNVAGAFTHVYQAGLRAASAMVRAAGYRLRGAVGGHHHTTFYAASAPDEAPLPDRADAMQTIRGGRHTALYGDEDELEAGDLALAQARSPPCSARFTGGCASIGRTWRTGFVAAPAEPS